MKNTRSDRRRENRAAKTLADPAPAGGYSVAAKPLDDGFQKYKEPRYIRHEDEQGTSRAIAIASNPDPEEDRSITLDRETLQHLCNQARAAIAQAERGNS